MRKKDSDKPNVKIAEAIVEQYRPKTASDVKDAVKDIFGPIFEKMLQEEMDAHLGYQNNDHGAKTTENRRNGYIHKKVTSDYGNLGLAVPRDRDGSFEPVVVPKRQKDITGIADQVLGMFSKGMSQRDIADMIEGIYGFKMSAETVSNITNCILDEVNEWQNRPLQKLYTFVFVDCLYVTVRRDYEVRKMAVYVILGYDVNGMKDILGLWLGDSEGKHQWMQIFDELKNRGVEDIMFISMDGVSGLEEGAKSIFPEVVVQRCIVHIIRNSIKYVPYKDYKAYTQQLKKLYGSPSLKAAEAEFEKFRQA